MQSDGMLNFGIIGCGSIAPTHAAAVAQLGHRVLAVADPLADRAAALAEKFAVPRRYDDHLALCSDAEIDAVCVCSPSGMHAGHAIAALLAGKHVLVEKPMDVTLEACERLSVAAATSGRQVGVISQHRFDAASVTARELIAAGAIGRIVLAHADVRWLREQSYYDSAAWRGTRALDGGALMNQAIHTVDVLQWLCGGVRSVHARLATADHRMECEDVAVLSLELANGAPASLVATTCAFDGFPVRIEVFGTEGSILLEGDAIRRVALRDGRTFESAAAAEHAVRVARGGTASVKDDPGAGRPSAPEGASWGDAHRAQFRDFVDALRTGRRPAVDVAEARKPVAIILAAYESARRGTSVPVA